MSKKKHKAKQHKQAATSKPSGLRYIFPAALIVLIVIVAVVLINNNNNEGNEEAMDIDVNPVAVIEMEDGGTIKSNWIPKMPPTRSKTLFTWQKKVSTTA